MAWPAVICSGAMYSGVPSARPGSVSRVTPVSALMPKSTSVSRPSPSRSRFSGFKSRCTTPREWRYASTSPSCRRMAPARVGSTGCLSLTSALTGWPSTSCITKKCMPMWRDRPRKRGSAGWLSFSSSDASRSKRLRNSGLSARWTPSVLSATASPVKVSVARSTLPMPPSPSLPSTRQRPA